MGNNQNKWRSEELHELRKLAEIGYSAGEIGRRLGRSRNSVKSKCHFEEIPLGQGGNSTPQQRLRVGNKYAGHRLIAPNVPRATGRGRRHVPHPAPVNPKSACVTHKPDSGLFSIANADEQAVTIMAARDGQCRFPLGEPGVDEFRFCGHKTARGPYCEAHAIKAFTRQTPPEEKPRADRSRNNHVRVPRNERCMMDDWQ